jgi:hypothetical protein
VFNSQKYESNNLVSWLTADCLRQMLVSEHSLQGVCPVDYERSQRGAIRASTTSAGESVTGQQRAASGCCCVAWTVCVFVFVGRWTAELPAV